MIQLPDARTRRAFDMATEIANSRASVLIDGEAGVGKDVLARFVHERSARAGQNFVSVNCASIPDVLLDRALFGHARAASDESVTRGAFETADRGTLVLEDVGALPLLLQDKVLRVLREGEIASPTGGGIQRVNVRLIATTTENLAQRVLLGRFREDLLSRLNVISLQLLPLRDRPRDLEALARGFVTRAAIEHDRAVKMIAPCALDRLRVHAWPGNVRELRNILERSFLLAGDATHIRDHDLRLPIARPTESTELALKPGMTVAEAERALIIKTLEHTEQNRTRAADLLGISIRTLRNKLHEYREVS